jgi:alkylhydroperoxidase/carboxymuconolactone decarboxylase family protein YurZ
MARAGLSVAQRALSQACAERDSALRSRSQGGYSGLGYCIDIHGAAARKAGATDAEPTEAALVAAAIRAGGAITHATHLWAADAPAK